MTPLEANISRVVFSAAGTIGFGVFAFDRNGTIIADALKPDLVVGGCLLTSSVLGRPGRTEPPVPIL